MKVILVPTFIRVVDMRTKKKRHPVMTVGVFLLTMNGPNVDVLGATVDLCRYPPTH